MKASQKIIFLIGFIVTGILAAGYFVIYPIFQNITQEYAKVLALKSELTKANFDIQNISNFKKISQERAGEWSKFEALLVNPDDDPRPFVIFLEEISKASQLATFDIVPADPKKLPEDVWPSIEVKLSGKAPYPNLARFLEKLENAPYLMEVKTVDIRNPSMLAGQTIGEQRPAFGDVQYAIVLKVYTK